MTKLLAMTLSASLILSGCGLFKQPKPELVVADRVEYVVKIPPAESMELPPPVKPINVDSSMQSNAAQWIIDNEARILSLENKLKSIASFFKVEQDKLKDKASEENKKSLDAAIKKQADTAIETVKKEVVK